MQGVLARLIAWQVSRPWHALLLALVLTIPSVLVARRLELHTGFESLLPEDKASVRELKRVAARTAGVSTLAIVIDGRDKRALQRFADDLVVALRRLDGVGTAEDGVHAEQAFLREHRLLFVPLEKLQTLHDRIEDRFDYEVNGSVFGDVPPPVTKETIEETLGASGQGVASTGPPYPDGYTMNAEGTRLVVLVRTPIEPGDLTRSRALQASVRDAIQRLDPARYDPSIVYGFTGDLVTSAEQYGAVKDDLASVGIAGIVMILLVDFAFFLRVRAVLAMALSIGIGVLWTFAATRVLIGHLNTSSGFLVSIVFGNGINFGILLRARFNEARRAGDDLATAVHAAYRDTLRPTLTVAAAASAGYVSLATTSFRGFRDFGLIGGYGMLLCWLATYAFMVPLLVLFDRAPLPQPRAGSWLARLRTNGIPFGVPFSFLPRAAPRLLAAVGLVVGIAAMVITVRWVRADPLEYDLTRLENDPVGTETTAVKLGEAIGPIVGRNGPDGMAIMVDRLDQVQPLTAALLRRRDDAPPDAKPFSKVVSIYDLVPPDQAAKLELLQRMRARLVRIHELGKIGEDDWTKLAPELPPAELRAFGVDDLPERVARPFTENDGTRGRIVFIVPTDGRSVRDVHYLLMWADSFRETKLPGGEVIYGSGRAVLFADMLASVIAESPKAIVFSFGATAIVVLLAFVGRRGAVRATVLVLSALILGVALMGAAMALLDVKINFLDFVAVPITFGIGVDYAINVVHRWQREPVGSVPRIVRETGGAVVLCSLTTTLGYLALIRSINAGVRSFGVAAVLGELGCVIAAIVVLPAVLVVIERMRPAPISGGEAIRPA